MIREPESKKNFEGT